MLALMLLLAQADGCPWINAATASGFLGTAVTMSVTRDTANREDASCSFTGKNAALRIVVQTMDTPRSGYTAHAAACGSNIEPLKAIGNEAVVCTPDEPRQSTQVIGRVRNRIFTVLITTPDVEKAREKARAVAEQVAGFLF
jgi:hypothetical protein